MSPNVIASIRLSHISEGFNKTLFVTDCATQINKSLSNGDYLKKQHVAFLLNLYKRLRENYKFT